MKCSHKLRCLEEGDVTKRWADIVMEYSDLTSTKATDRLPSISAISKQVQHYRPEDIYLAGLWQSALLDDIL